MVGKTDEVQSPRKKDLRLQCPIQSLLNFNQLEFFTKPMNFSQNSKHYWSIVRLRSVVREVASGISKVIGRTKLAVAYGKATEHDQQQEEEVFVADTTEEEPNLTEESQDGGQSSLHRSIKVVGIATSRLEMNSA
ncbi:uncharacterized protein RSE6_05169 [Rhynchosporium secalis]|uniref:Uncharacterized protein n=1 Tax=Rhynchosporium secalis TaxID=38038 RepID=A0A1E1M748_RHYSE|nr:uncharacterized protein RSE6_05169 [Rhynchosporium secalis]